METSKRESAEALPDRIGPFRILRLLGEGAMGRVYLAEQTEPQREVALKVIRSLASGEYLQRFRREAELLAGLEHPRIARIYQAGTAETAGGPVPYLAMEYIRGVDLAEWARSTPAPLETKLRLIAALAHAVQHAHARGVIHRDLKPGNVLVDAQGEPHILDFGVARMMGDEALTRMTAAGEVLGTLPYMSLEQLTGDTQAVDTRSDVYALGVIAYELLAGRLPHPELPRATLIAAVETLRSGNPPRLVRLLPAAAGDVETIVMKAMAREPAQRYSSAAELAADIERFLAHEPIAARPPTARYLLALYVRRHRAIAAVSLFGLCTLVAATAISLQYAYSEARARAQAESRTSELAAVNDFMRSMFAAADPERSLGERLTVREVLDSARGELAAADLPPAVESRLRRALASAYVSLGLADEGLSQLQAAQALTLDPMVLPDIAFERAAALQAAGRDDEAVQTLTTLIATLRDRTPAEIELRLRARLDLGALTDAEGDHAKGETMLREALAETTIALGAEHELALDLRRRIALSLNRQGRYDESQAMILEVVRALSGAYGPEHPRVLNARLTEAQNLRDLGRLDEAIIVFQQVLQAREKIFGDGHTQVQTARAGLASALAAAGRAAQGVPLSQRAYEGAITRLGPDADLSRSTASLHAYVLSEAGQYEDAVLVLRTLIEQVERRPGGILANDLAYYNNLANNLVKLGRLHDARAVLERLLPQAERLVGRDHTHYGLFEDNYGECLRLLGALDAARVAFEHARAVLTERLGAEHPRTQRVTARLQQTLDQMRAPAPAGKDAGAQE